MLNNKELLKTFGFKITPTRLSILEIFQDNNKPINASFIYLKLKDKINEVTVYRNLTSFEKKGILRRVDLRKEAMCFELNNNHHHHIVCNKCGLVEDFRDNKELEKILINIIEKSSKFKSIKEHSLELFGFCRMCS
jgi:Fe2+ or Zn2+ uptake regulation protein